MGLTSKIRKAVSDYSEYRRIASEIETLSPREAADIGISQRDARKIAYASVYGK